MAKVTVESLAKSTASSAAAASTAASTAAAAAAASIITIPSIDPTTAFGGIPSAPCGLDLNMETMKGHIDDMKSTISGYASSAAGIADNISSIGQGLADKVNGLADDLVASIGTITLPSMDLAGDVSSLLGSIGSANPLGIGAKIAAMKINFPSFNISGMLDKLKLGTFDPCKDVPNLKMIGGSVVSLPIPPVSPIIDALSPIVYTAVPPVPVLSAALDRGARSSSLTARRASRYAESQIFV